jgi:ABC-type phosphate/phosphonate transport system substrate-binding protein
MTFRVRFLIALVLLSLTISACGAGNLAPTPTLPPAATSTPISTPLPDVPTAVPAGYDAENPLQLVIVPASAEESSGLVERLQTEITERSGLSVTVKLAASQAEAAGDLCSSDRGTVSAVWVSGMTAAIAASTGCGVPILMQNAGTADQPDTGNAGVLLLQAELASAGLEALPGRTFCRTTYTDFYSWTVPLLMLRGEGIDITTLEDIDEFDSYEDLVAAITAGDCTVAGVPVAVWEDLLAADETLTETVSEVGRSVEFPYAMLVFPFEASLDVISPIVDALLEMDYTFGMAQAPIAEVTPDAEATADVVEAEATAEATELAEDAQASFLAPFFGEGIFQRVSDEDFAALQTFLRESGVQFEELSD